MAMWSPQFGDRDKQAVLQERDDSYRDYLRRDTKIVECKSARSTAIHDEWRRLNRGLDPTFKLRGL